MAAALSEYDNNPEIIEEAKYGELTYEYYGWGYETDSNQSKKHTLGFDYCT